jgi:hypothetical protein
LSCKRDKSGSVLLQVIRAVGVIVLHMPNTYRSALRFFVGVH